jgi:ferredoxin--NADP+ reductase
MPHVIANGCCNDATCILDCPVDCIRPTPDDPDFATAEMLYIDPSTCIDCGACVPACPVGAIYQDNDLPGSMARFAEINADYFLRNPLRPFQGADPAPARPDPQRGPLRVAIVGAGPAGAYAAQELLERGNITVSVLDRLPVPGGLVRYGVAPDHQQVKDIASTFDAAFDRPEFAYHLNVELGTHLRVAELTDHHHAVIVATGASRPVRPAIPGEDLAGCLTAAQFIGWYNGHPDYAHLDVDLSSERVVVIGNGNVALDVARILLLGPDELARTDIAAHALRQLQESSVREVVVMGRRGPECAKFSLSELIALDASASIDLALDLPDSTTPEPTDDLKVALVYGLANRVPSASDKRIVFAFGVTPTRIVGQSRVERLKLDRAVGTGLGGTPRDELAASLVICATGYRGVPIDGLPFDAERGTIPNLDGRVIDNGEQLERLYVTGWIARGGTGGIGLNRQDAAQVVDCIIDDFNHDRLGEPARTAEDFAALVAQRQPDRIDREGWLAIDHLERQRGLAQGRRRNKLVTLSDMIAAARQGEQ